MKQPRNLIGPIVRKIRFEKNLSQNDLAARAQKMGWDISRDTINKIERRVRWVSDFELVLLAECLEIDVRGLLPSPKDVWKQLDEFRSR